MIKYYLFKLSRALVRSVPPRMAYAIGAFVAEVTYVFSRRSKANFQANLLHVLKYRGEDIKSPEVRAKIRRLTRKNFRNFAYYLVDFFRFSQFESNRLSELVEIVGTENVDRVLAGGRGLIGVTAHVGNWELGGMIFSLLGYPVNAIALSHHNTKLNRLFVNQRALGGMKVIPVGRAALQGLKALRRNEVVVILGDRDVTERGVAVDFFGTPCFLPRGPAVLAVRSGAGLLFGYFVRESTHCFKVAFNEPLEVDRSAPPEEQEDRIIKALVKEMEECIMENLSQWYMYYRLWPNDRF